MAMKRLFLLGFAGMLATLLGGCPIYDNHGQPDGCVGDCNPNPNPPPDASCAAPGDCGLNETCGSDNTCHSGDCTIWGCTGELECVVQEDLTAKCETGGGPNPGVVYCGNPGDCSSDQTCSPDGTCKTGTCDQDLGGGQQLGCIFGYACTDDGTTRSCLPENPAACGEDGDCVTMGDLCVSGVCTAPADHCFDQTQCISGNRCVEGKCTPACAADADCPSSYRCATNLGICITPAMPCTITNDCGGPESVCVEGACVPRSINGVCPADTVWVENGCIPNQSPTFVCTTDGQQAECFTGSICLHHSCYIACDPPNGNACAGLPSFNQCKSVTTVSGSHEVCGSADNLGGECDGTLACDAGKICIDGYCK
jgi:hypothetical protein